MFFTVENKEVVQNGFEVYKTSDNMTVYFKGILWSDYDFTKFNFSDLNNIHGCFLIIYQTNDNVWVISDQLNTYSFWYNKDVMTNDLLSLDQDEYTYTIDNEELTIDNLSESSAGTIYNTEGPVSVYTNLRESIEKAYSNNRHIDDVGELASIANELLTNNVKKIFEQYGDNVGMLLSGGIDSMVIMSIIIKNNLPLKSVGGWVFDYACRSDMNGRIKDYHAYLKHFLPDTDMQFKWFNYDNYYDGDLNLIRTPDYVQIHQFQVMDRLVKDTDCIITGDDGDTVFQHNVYSHMAWNLYKFTDDPDMNIIREYLSDESTPDEQIEHIIKFLFLDKFADDYNYYKEPHSEYYLLQRFKQYKDFDLMDWWRESYETGAMVNISCKVYNGVNAYSPYNCQELRNFMFEYPSEKLLKLSLRNPIIQKEIVNQNHPMLKYLADKMDCDTLHNRHMMFNKAAIDIDDVLKYLLQVTKRNIFKTFNVKKDVEIYKNYGRFSRRLFKLYQWKCFLEKWYDKR